MRPDDRLQGNRQSRRAFLAGASAMGMRVVLRRPPPASAESALETTRIRLSRDPAICFAPQYLAEELLRLEGFATVEYVNVAGGPSVVDVLDSGAVDLKMVGMLDLIPALDAGRPIVVLAGVHAGCYELFSHTRLHAIRDLKGKRVAASAMGVSDHLFIASMLAYVGIDPARDINWVWSRAYAESMRLFADGKVDAFLGFPPQPQELRVRKIGHVIVDTARDRPWSQYFCCAVAANREFVTKHPVATKRALRAILKATDICAAEPERAARDLVTKGYEASYEVGLEVLKGLPYNRWRESDPEDTLRFHALRLHEAGLIKSAPQRIIAQGADWRFLNELKRELKG